MLSLASFACKLTQTSRPYGRFELPGQNVDARLQHRRYRGPCSSHGSLAALCTLARAKPTLFLLFLCDRGKCGLFGDGVIGCDRGVHGGHKRVVCMAM